MNCSFLILMYLCTAMMHLPRRNIILDHVSFGIVQKNFMLISAFKFFPFTTLYLGFVTYKGLCGLRSLDPSARRAQISLGASSLMYRVLRAVCRNSRQSPSHRIRVSSGRLDVLILQTLVGIAAFVKSTQYLDCH